MQVLQKKNVLLQLPKNHVLILLQKKQVVNMCANNYLGLSDNSELISAAKESYDKWGIWFKFCSIYMWYTANS